MPNCALCANIFIKKHPKQRFCKLKCKDRYHNLHNPRGKFRHLKHTEIDAIDTNLISFEDDSWDYEDHNKSSDFF